MSVIWLVRTGIVPLLSNLFSLHLQFHAYHAQAITATASSSPILDTQHSRDRLMCLWSLSFFSVPQPTGISEREPFLMCLCKFYIWSRVSFFSFAFQTNKRRSRLHLISPRHAVFLVLLQPKSPSWRIIREKLFICKLITVSFAFRNFLYNFHAVMSNFTPGNVCSYNFIVWQQSSPIIISSFLPATNVCQLGSRVG